MERPDKQIITLHATPALAKLLDLPLDLDFHNLSKVELHPGNEAESDPHLPEEGPFSTEQESIWQLHAYELPNSRQMILLALESFSRAVLVVPINEDEKFPDSGALKHELMLRWCNEIAYLANEAGQLDEKGISDYIGSFMRCPKSIKWGRYHSEAAVQQLASVKRYIEHCIRKHQSETLSEQLAIDITETLNHRRRTNLEHPNRFFVPCYRLLADGLFRFGHMPAEQLEFPNPYQQIEEKEDIFYQVASPQGDEKQQDLPANVVCFSSFKDKNRSS